MTEKSRCVSAAALLRAEIRLLDGAIDGRQRRRVYRHHHFLRAAIALRQSLTAAVRADQNNRAMYERRMRAVLRTARRCAEAAVLEVRAARVDTVSVGLLFLAVSARAGCVAAAAAPSPCDVAEIRCAATGAGEFLVADEPLGRKRCRDECGALPQIANPSMGELVDAVLH